MKKLITGVLAVVAVASVLSGCSKNADSGACAGGGEACKAKMAAGGTCCGKCGGPNAKTPAR